jgi:hypothetical protein
MISYYYLFIRTDLPFEQQIVQAAHSALEAGRDLGKPTTHSHLILLPAKSETALRKIADDLTSRDIRFRLFYEPDINAYTSLTTEPLTEGRDYFRKHSLYKFKHTVHLT